MHTFIIFCCNVIRVDAGFVIYSSGFRLECYVIAMLYSDKDFCVWEISLKSDKRNWQMHLCLLITTMDGKWNRYTR